MKDDPVVYIPGRRASQGDPLGRYLPPVPEGVGAEWLGERVAPGGWVIDPFGSSPRLALEAAQAGYRVLAAVNNPVTRFLFELHAQPPTEEELRLALAEVSAAQKAGVRLEPHLRSLYLTRCANCGMEVEAQAFIWERGGTAPAARIYTCPRCKDSGERPATAQDAERADRASVGPLHRARALERVAPLSDPDRPFVEEALAMYLPRAVYVLFTLVNKLESIAPEHLHGLEALLLAGFDQGSTLWSSPPARHRPKQLTTPARFLERNIWLVLEETVTTWPAALRAAAGETPVPLVNWPETPLESGGVAIFEGRIRDLADQVQAAGNAGWQAAAVLTALPRPNQAYWTLSALWSGWLWGAECSAAIKSVIRRRRYDWDWHAEALHANLSRVAALLPPGTPALGLMSEVEPGFLTAAAVATARSGFALQGIALRSDEDQAQIGWKKGEPGAADAGDSTPAQEPLPAAIRRAATAYLERRGEPAAYLSLHGAILEELAQTGGLVEGPADSNDHSLERINAALSMALEVHGHFARFGGSSRALDVGLWWLPEEQREKGKTAAPLSDRVEVELVHCLQKNPGSPAGAVDRALCAAFPGLLTPESELAQACLESYAEQDGHAGWRLRPEDAPQARREEMQRMQTLLQAAGTQLSFSVDFPNHPGPSAVRWVDARHADGYIFYIIASAHVGGFISGEAQRPAKTSKTELRLRPVIVLPGGRATLIEYKLQHDPRLRKALADGWRLIKYRHVRRLAEDPLLTRDNLEAQLALDPLENRDPQMTLL